jgi:subtilase family serine protease
VTGAGRRRGTAAVVAAVTLGLAAVGAPAQAASGGPAAGAASRLGPAPADATVSLTLDLRFPGRDALAEYLAARRLQPASPPLTPAQIGERFGLPGPVLDVVTARLASAGIRVTERYDQRTALLAEGSVRAVEQLFQTRLDDYRDPDGTRYRAPSRAPRVPPALAGAVSDVEGLDTRPAFAPASTGRQTGGGSNATFVTPQQLQRIYNAVPLSQAGIDGQGQTIAIASLATLHGAEFADWASHFKTTTQPSQTIAIAPTAPRVNQRGWSANQSDEVALDLEMTRAVAPRATILDYSTQNDGEGLERILNQVVQDRRATIVSISYGNCEAVRGAALINGYESTFMAAQAAGVDVFAASGDSGPYDCNDANRSNDLRQSVNYPASSAYVTGVGGTTLSNQGDQLHESAWQEPAALAGSGGGRSAFVPRPAWQSSDVVHQGGSTRLVPDVAGPASPDFNLLIADFQLNRVTLETGGGTSAATPFWAGLTALIKQYVEGREHSFPNGNVNAMLYQIADNPAMYASAFHDVVTGGNQVFNASTGWDFLTGLGTPNIAGLANAVETIVHAGRP